jgi:hypothetical protein
VTTVVVSPTALSRAAAAAEGLDLLFERHDLAETFPSGTFSLVSAQFLQSPVEFPRERVLRQAAEAVAPGGMLVIVEHAWAPPWSGMRDVGPPTADETLTALDLPDGWEVVRPDVPGDRTREPADGSSECPSLGSSGRRRARSAA